LAIKADSPFGKVIKVLKQENTMEIHAILAGMVYAEISD
jgi:hypothetical protein